MNNLWVRWSAAAAIALAAFLVCWASLQFAADLDAAVALGWAIVPFSVVLALGGVWADRARQTADLGASATSTCSGRGKTVRVIQKQRATDNARQMQVGGNIRIEKEEK